MDILHPSMVHFPIGLLTFYTFLEVCSLVKPLKKILYNAKFLLVGSGTIAAIAARMAGEHDAEFFTQKHGFLSFMKSSLCMS